MWGFVCASFHHCPPMQSEVNTFWSIPDKRCFQKYRKGTSIRQAPVFRHLRAFRKSPWKFIIWMNELLLHCMLLVSYIQQYFNTSITVLTNQVWKLLIALLKVPNTGALTVLTTEWSISGIFRAIFNSLISSLAIFSLYWKSKHYKWFILMKMWTTGRNSCL